MIKFGCSAMILLAISAFPLAAQAPSFDNSGNGKLQGTYYFRQVVYQVGYNDGSLSGALSIYGNIAFDGNGKYTIAGAAEIDPSKSSPSSFSTTGTYSIAASGFGFLSNPWSSKDSIYGLVSNGIFVGSSTENTGGFNDLFIGAPLASPAPTAASFQGSYTMAGFLPGSDGTPGNAADVFFNVNADGQGNLGNVAIPGYYGTGGSTILTQNASGVKYFFSNGAAVVTFPSTSTSWYFAGQEYLYFSPDGNFVFGGSPNGFDMVVGIRNGGSAQKLNGLYYQAGIDQNVSLLGSQGYADLDTFYGSFSANGGNIVAADRLLNVFNANTFSFSYTDTYPASITGTYSDVNLAQFAVGSSGGVRIGAGIGPYLGLSVALQAPALTGSGVFLNPAGIANAASAAPFTAGIAPGELITLYGSNLAPRTAIAPGVPFPNQLAGVQVTFNGLAAPLYYVSAGQIAVIVPYGSAALPFAQIKVVNNNVASNTVTEFVYKSAGGVFTLSQDGLGRAAVEHSDGTVVTAAHPAQPGETLAAFVTGLGLVNPAVPDGAPGPSNPLSYSVYYDADPAKSLISATINGESAPVYYAGLAPTLSGLYQINFTVPADATSGDLPLDISGPDSTTAQAVIAVGTTGAAAAAVRSTGQASGRFRPSVTPGIKRPRTQSSPALGTTWAGPRPALK